MVSMLAFHCGNWGSNPRQAMKFDIVNVKYRQAEIDYFCPLDVLKHTILDSDWLRLVVRFNKEDMVSGLVERLKGDKDAQWNRV